ncbi:LysE family transporter [Streptomyces lichenis]|uniref:LysE family translocator n=1 Tax=Streptomyces lichenis TaxID=2306967 RepID=A0ABT0IC39_9ACTN|nr:LysE family transporter [Streptomyces lichenis]MCK8678884.1 LysE family translocator [Streptomyces lichenis]
MSVLPAWSAGLGLGFLVALPLGPIGLLCVRSVLRNGFLCGFAIGLGATAIDMLYAGLGLAGVGRLLDVQVLRTALGLAGAVVMVYLGVRSLRSAFKARGAIDTEGETVLPWAAFRTALTATAANPATIGYWAAAFAAATAANLTGTLSASVGMLIGVGCGTLLWFTTLSVSVMLFRRWFTSRMLQGVDLLAGVGVIFFGGVLAYQAVG